MKETKKPKAGVSGGKVKKSSKKAKA